MCIPEYASLSYLHSLASAYRLPTTPSGMATRAIPQKARNTFLMRLFRASELTQRILNSANAKVWCRLTLLSLWHFGYACPDSYPTPAPAVEAVCNWTVAEGKWVGPLGGTGWIVLLEYDLVVQALNSGIWGWLLDSPRRDHCREKRAILYVKRIPPK